MVVDATTHVSMIEIVVVVATTHISKIEAVVVLTVLEEHLPDFHLSPPPASTFGAHAYFSRTPLREHFRSQLLFRNVHFCTFCTEVAHIY